MRRKVGNIMPNIDQFFDDLEDVLDKHLDGDWEWSYEHDKPLSITSETLAKAWEERGD